ncbi:hypothetical protein AHF37_05291 [Paragonimus kellicotti]|nr:hypothetical protein AHF37_05291 [Paragonimus kellicotti]
MHTFHSASLSLFAFTGHRSLVARFQEDTERGFKTMELGLRDSDGEDPQASSSGEGLSDDDIEVDLDKESDTQSWNDVYISPEQLPDHLATLSGLPTTYLSSLLHLDLIRERNRRAVAPSKTDDETKLPFFLPVVETAKGLAWVDADNGTMEVPSSKTNSITETTTSAVEPVASRALKRRSMLDDDALTAIEPVPGLMTRLIQARKDKECGLIALFLLIALRSFVFNNAIILCWITNLLWIVQLFCKTSRNLLIDCFRVNTPITSLSLSPAGEFLATTHANSLGVHLWDNRGTYQRLHLQPLADDYRPPLTEKPVAVPSRSLVARFQEDTERGFKTMELGLRDSDGEDPQASSSGEGLSDDDIEVDLDKESDTQSWNDVYISPEQLPDHLATLSGLPTTYLSSLLHLDLIRERNRRAVAPSKTDDETKLPFFLPVVETAKGLAWVDADNGTMEVPSSKTNSITETTTSAVEPVASRALKRRSMLDDDALTAIEPVPGLMTRLIQARKDKEFDEIMQTLKSIGPSALDLEIRLLAVSAEEELAAHASLKDPSCSSNLVDTTRDRLHGFLRLLINRFERNLDVDLACVCLESLLLRHGDLLLVKPSDRVQIGAPDDVGNQIHALLSAEHVVNKATVDCRAGFKGSCSENQSCQSAHSSFNSQYMFG